MGCSEYRMILYCPLTPVKNGCPGGHCLAAIRAYSASYQAWMRPPWQPSPPFPHRPGYSMPTAQWPRPCSAWHRPTRHFGGSWCSTRIRQIWKPSIRAITSSPITPASTADILLWMPPGGRVFRERQSRSLSQALAWSACPAIRKVPTPHSSGLGFCPQSLHALQSLHPRRGLAVASRGYRALATLPNSGPTEPSRRDPGTEASCRRGRLFVDIRHTVTPPSTTPRNKALAHPEYFTNRSAASQGEDYPAPRIWQTCFYLLD